MHDYHICLRIFLPLQIYSCDLTVLMTSSRSCIMRRVVFLHSTCSGWSKLTWMTARKVLRRPAGAHLATSSFWRAKLSTHSTFTTWRWGALTENCVRVLLFMNLNSQKKMLNLPTAICCLKTQLNATDSYLWRTSICDWFSSKSQRSSDVRCSLCWEKKKTIYWLASFLYCTHHAYVHIC